MASAAMMEPVTAVYLLLLASATEARPSASPAAAMASSDSCACAVMVETNLAPPVPSTVMEDNIPIYVEMVETTLPSSLAKMNSLKH